MPSLHEAICHMIACRTLIENSGGSTIRVLTDLRAKQAAFTGRQAYSHSYSFLFLFLFLFLFFVVCVFVCVCVIEACLKKKMKFSRRKTQKCQCFECMCRVVMELCCVRCDHVLDWY